MPSAQFLRLPGPQQHRIVHASLTTFADDGYDLASTNRIVREAGISKGVLFKYFKDKEALFLYVAQVETETYFAGLPVDMNGSIFDWIRAATAYKLRYIKERPLTYRLFARMAKEPGHPVYARALRSQTDMIQRLGSETPRWGFGPLRPGVTQQQAMHLLQWISTGLQEQFAAKLPDIVDEEFDAAFASIVAEFDTYLEIVKNGLYGEGAPS